MGPRVLDAFKWMVLWVIIIIETPILLGGMVFIIWGIYHRIKDERQQRKEQKNEDK